MCLYNFFLRVSRTLYDIIIKTVYYNKHYLLIANTSYNFIIHLNTLKNILTFQLQNGTNICPCENGPEQEIQFHNLSITQDYKINS